MFDKLIVSEPKGCSPKRRGYFVVSTIVVGLLFLVLVVASIFADDFSLGSGGLDELALLTPIEMTDTPPRPEPQPRSSQQSSSASSTDLPTRRVNMAPADGSTLVPDSISTAPNASLARPRGPFIPGKIDSDTASSPGSGRPTGTVGGDGDSPGFGSGTKIKNDRPEPDTDIPPPVTKREPIRNLGIVTGYAKYLPKPPYPPIALQAHASGAVDVHVMIDESGKVISAHASSGHPMLRSAAERAALQARFSPTVLSNVPVKVTGVIVYNFIQ